MIKVIKYKIKFPFGASFDKDPQIIFLNKIYNEIKSCTCINNNECDSCLTKNKCLFYLLSGERFSQYPSIGVLRNCVNKRIFSRNEVLELTFVLIGIAVNYSDFITEYFASIEYIVGEYFQKILIEQNIVDSDKLYSGCVKLNNIIIDCEDITNSIKYYNEKYKCDFVIPEGLELKNTLAFSDGTYYYFDKQKFFVKGNLGELKVVNYPEILLKFGVGKFAFIGGGCANEN